MPSLRVGDLPDDVYQALSAAARAEQRSLSQQVVVELRRALGIEAPDRRANLLRHLRSSGRRLPITAVSPELLQGVDRERSAR
jgi:hypothetical protein